MGMKTWGIALLAGIAWGYNKDCPDTYCSCDITKCQRGTNLQAFIIGLPDSRCKKGPNFAPHAGCLGGIDDGCTSCQLDGNTMNPDYPVCPPCACAMTHV